MSDSADRQTRGGVIDFWFPKRYAAGIDVSAHRDDWLWRMRGGADGEITARFSDLTASAAEGHLAEWGSRPHGRLALVIVLDEFSRSVWRGTARAFAGDTIALSLAMAASRTAITWH